MNTFRSFGRTKCRGAVLRCRAESTPTIKKPDLTQVDGTTMQGTSRKRNEDRYDIRADQSMEANGEIAVVMGVFDGHGGTATSEWLEQNLLNIVVDKWQNGNAVNKCIQDAFLDADKQLLAPGGFMGMGERGIGGSKCGSTAAVAILYQDKDGAIKVHAANVGDARVLIARSGKAVQLTTDHVPDDEDERNRIEAQNPNPKLPLVRYVGDTWRVGGLLALSRAFGDAYMKGSLQFEGIPAGSDDYSSGFGVIAEPTQNTLELTPEDTWIIVCSDGLFANVERGGGGGLENDQIVAMCDAAAASGKSPDEVANDLCRAAQSAGSTDDVTVTLFKL